MTDAIETPAEVEKLSTRLITGDLVRKAVMVVLICSSRANKSKRWRPRISRVGGIWESLRLA